MTNDKEIKKFVSDVISGKATGEVRAYGKVSDKLSNAVKVERQDLDITDHYIEIVADNLREAYKRHALPKEAGDIPLSEQEFLRIHEYINDFDGINAISEYKNKVEIHLYKRNKNGYVKIILVYSNERKSVQVTKILGNSKEKFEQKYAKKIERITGSPRSQTVETEGTDPAFGARHTAGVLSNNSIHDILEIIQKMFLLSENRLNVTMRLTVRERKVSLRKTQHYFFGLLLNISEANIARTNVAVIPPDVAVKPPVSTPKKPFSSTACLTPCAIAYPKPVSGTVAPHPAKSTILSYIPKAVSKTPRQT